MEREIVEKKEEFVPYVPADRTLPELTTKAIIMGVVLAVVLGAANAYTGLYVGMTVCASIPAAVISMAIFRALKGNILENNMVQTIGSAGEALAAGIIFTIPALLIWEVWEPHSLWAHYWEIAIIALLGGLLGVLFMVTIRRALIVETVLPYPEGVACAETLKAGARGGEDFRLLATGFGIGGLVRLITGPGSLGVFKATATKIVSFGRTLIGGGLFQKQFGIPQRGIEGFFFGEFECNPILIGIGYIVGFEIATYIFSGAILAFWVLTPLVMMLVGAPEGVSLLEAWEGTWYAYVRPIAVGTMVVGAIWTLVQMRGVMGAAIGRATAAFRGRASSALARTERELSYRWVFGGIGVLSILTFGLYWYITGRPGISLVSLIIMAIAAFIFTAISAYMVGLVGSSNNPVSGMTLATCLVGSLALLAIGAVGPKGVAAVIMIIAIACVAMGIAGDQMQDLKTGYLLGATPKSQQIAQIIGIVPMALLIPAVLHVVDKAYIIGSSELPAFQSWLMGYLATGVLEQTMSWILIVIGAALGIILVLFNKPVLPVAVGIYLPFSLGAGIFAGGIIRWISDKILARGEIPAPEKGKATNRGVIGASGLIAGAAIMAIILAFFIVAGIDLAVWTPTIAWPGMIVMASIGAWLIYVSVGKFVGRKSA